MMTILADILADSWKLLHQSALFVLFGILVAGLLRICLNASTVTRHLGRGRFRSVIKASLLGIPIPL
jgi:hypothetical protein